MARWSILALLVALAGSPVCAGDYTLTLTEEQEAALLFAAEQQSAPGQPTTPALALERQIQAWLTDVQRQMDARLAHLPLQRLTPEVRAAVEAELPPSLRERVRQHRREP